MKNKHQIIKFIIIIILFWFAQYVYVPYQTPFLAAINVASSFIGIVVGAYGFSQMLLRIPLGMLADWHLNHKLLITLGTLLAGLASIMRVLFPSGIGFLLGNIFSGIASSTWLSFMVYFLKLRSDVSKVENMGILVMANNLGMLLGFVVSSLFYEKIAMKGLCILGVLAGILACIMTITLPTFQFSYSSGKNSFINLINVFKNKTLLICGVLAFIQQGIQMATTMSFTSQVIKEINAPSYAEGLSSIIYMCSAVLFARITSSKYIAKFSDRSILIVSYILLALYCFAIPLARQIYLIYLLQVIPGVGTGILFAILNAAAISNVPQKALSTATGVFQSIYALGMTLFPIFAGQLRAQYSMTISFIVMGILALMGNCIVIIFWQKKSNNN
ncbi:MFS transporter [Lactobacillus sp. ESL0261]|uniref:MFS transporter n=1 Tax=Lactobacillus sp. ESL0261 TaxID=2069348 RepID=UPI000EFC076C|nr:MFS transporter [Lactobacillus sp. ESL0261]RMC56850.1 MFS transporter [Lactobacillus sp. ESL0261]